jgi:hypothetical protein
MNTVRHTLQTLGILAAFALISAAASAQAPSQEPPAANPPPHVGANERAAGAQKQIAGDTKPKDKLVGLPVETASGEQLGSVVDIVRDKSSGKPTYAVVAIDTDTTAVPYDTATAMMRDGKVIMSQAKLARAPKVKQSEWLDETKSGWRSQADRYWGNSRSASKSEAKKPAER